MKLSNCRSAIMAVCLLFGATVPAAAQSDGVRPFPEITPEESQDMLTRKVHKLPLTDRQRMLIDQFNQARDHNLALAKSSYKAGDYATAILAYKSLNSEGIYSWQVAESYLRMNKRAEALTWYRKAMYYKMKLSHFLTGEMTQLATLPGDAVSGSGSRRRMSRFGRTTTRSNSVGSHSCSRATRIMRKPSEFMRKHSTTPHGK